MCHFRFRFFSPKRRISVLVDRVDLVKSFQTNIYIYLVFTCKTRRRYSRERVPKSLACLPGSDTPHGSNKQPCELIMASCVPARAPMVLGSAAQGCMRSLKGWNSSIESIKRTNSGMFGGSDPMAKSNACLSPLLRDADVVLAEAC